MNFFSTLFDTSDFPARWHCGRWTDAHGWLHIVSDIGIWSAYFAIPCVLLYFGLRRKDVPFRKIFFLFGAFILLCGLTHLMEAVIFWWPAYRLGIPVNMQHQVFEMFSQIDRPMEKGYTGLGIGLTLVKTLTEMHGGRVEVHSEGTGQGSEFTVRLPILMELPVASERPELPAQAASSSRLRVLIVDDNRAAVEMLSLVVKMLGNEIRTACDGQEGVEVAAEFLPDIVLMDIGMPRMNGYEAASFIRNQPWGAKVTLVALTGWGQDEDKRRTTEAGFDHHLVKPAEPSELQQLFAAVGQKLSSPQ